MKNYKQILEAINQGIKFALDDFEDNEQIQGLINSKVKYLDGTKEYLDLLRDEVVDLELPSGTLWCKYNLDVNPNLLSKPEDWYGGYYAWGELKPNKTNKNNKIYFGWDNYKFEHNSKYCDNPVYGLNGFTDNLTLLLPEDDAAFQNKKFYNFKFYIPTKEKCVELINYTNNYWINNYDPNKIIHSPKDDKGIQGLNGRVFVGKNANLMFIPAAGCQYRFNNNEHGSCCNLWSSSLILDYPNSVFSLIFDSNNIYIDDNYRCVGCSIRPVVNL